MRQLKLLLTLALLPCVYSCYNSDGKIHDTHIGFSRLKIAIDTEANFYLDSIRLSAPYKFRLSNYQEYDSTIKNWTYVFDSVRNGDLDLTLSSFLHRDCKKKINLESDTTILIAKKELYNFTDAETKILPSSKLNEGDTLTIGLYSRGCFHFLKENVIISKKEGKYNVSFNTTRGQAYGYPPMNINKVFDELFGKKIDSFYHECEDLLRDKSLCVSTTTTFIYLRTGNIVYRLPDIGCGEWQGYDHLVLAIDPPWPKEKNGS